MVKDEDPLSVCGPKLILRSTPKGDYGLCQGGRSIGSEDVNHHQSILIQLDKNENTNQNHIITQPLGANEIYNSEQDQKYTTHLQETKSITIIK